VGWRLRLLILTVLLGCVGLLLLARSLAAQHSVDARWQAGSQGQVELAGSDLAALQPYRSQVLVGLAGATSTVGPIDGLVLQRSARWLIDDTSRQRHREMHERLAHALSQALIGLQFADGSIVELPLHRRGFGGLGTSFWLLGSLALVLYLAAGVALLARLSLRNLLYALMSLSQAGNLLFAAIESTPGLGLPLPLLAWEMSARMAFDLVTATAAVHAASLFLRGSAAARRIAYGAWLAVSVLIVLAAVGRLAHAWWWTQLGVAVLCMIAIALLSGSHRGAPNPHALQLRRFGIVALGTWTLLTLSLAVADRFPDVQHSLLSVVSITWYVFLASLLLLVSFLSRRQQILREFSLLAAISAVATSLDLLFVDVSSLGPFASLTLTLFVSLAVYSGARQWILNLLLGSILLTTVHTFEQLYRLVREAQAHPQQVPMLLLQLLRNLFKPMLAELVGEAPPSARVTESGTALLVPVPALVGRNHSRGGAILIRFAQQGRRLFTDEDVRLADRITEQLRRAAAFDRAVEQGRNEERLRLAQDLHDDIGARLLTQMYKAQTPELEEYVRHMLKDLKTLTRGLAAPSHRLSQAAAEWKADLAQRLRAADLTLAWSFAFDRDIPLNMVQWSALTRILGELVRNVIAHAGARQVDIALQLEGDRLELSVTDGGTGRNPGSWSHGLGLGAVRKRVRQLDGDVEWLEAKPTGIDCRVRVPLPTSPE
jgi:signal transduction histidine kinase